MAEVRLSARSGQATAIECVAFMLVRMIPLGERRVLDLDVDRTAVMEYVRRYGSGRSGGAPRDCVPDPAGA